MADRRIEEEIEEILAKLDVGETGDTITGEKEPISFEAKRKARKPGMIARLRDAVSVQLPAINPATLLFAGAGTMLAGLILSAWIGPLIWLAFAGVLLFIIAFAWSFMRKTPANAPGGGAAPGNRGPKKVFWRDRYIEYEPSEPNAVDRIRRRFRKR